MINYNRENIKDNFVYNESDIKKIDYKQKLLF